MKVRLQPLWAFLIIWTIAFSLSLVIIDPDFGWHIQSGNYIREAGIPSHDIFTYTASTFPWVNHEWLNDVLASIFYNVGGIPLIAAFYACIWAGGMVLASRLYNLPTITISFVSILDFVMARPSAWALFFFALTERIISENNKKWILYLPVLFLAWANFHGSFLIGLVILIYYKLILKSRISWPIIVASFAATFVNPYGPRVYEEIFRTVFDSQLHSRINEWRSWSMPNYFLLSGTVLIGIFLAMNSKLKKKEFLLPLILGIASLSSVRYYLIFMVGSLRYFEQAVSQLQTNLTERFGRFAIRYFSITLTACISGIIFYNAITSQIPVPVQSSAYLKQNSCPGNLFNFYDYGGYLILHNPEHKVFIDGRMPSWKEHGTDYFELYTDAISSPERRKEIFKKYNIRCVLFSTNDGGLLPVLAKEGWQTVFTEPSSTLLER